MNLFQFVKKNRKTIYQMPKKEKAKDFYIQEIFMKILLKESQKIKGVLFDILKNLSRKDSNFVFNKFSSSRNIIFISLFGK